MKLLALVLVFTLSIHPVGGDEQPSYAIADPAIDANFKRIYQLMDQHRHENDDSSPLNLFVSSESYSQLDGYKVYVGSLTVPANTAVLVTSPTWTSIQFIQTTQVNTSSFTCMVEQWASSFTVTNTGGTAKKVHWWLFGI